MEPIIDKKTEKPSEQKEAEEPSEQKVLLHDSSYWIKSSLSYSNGACVEVTDIPGEWIGVRTSTDTAGAILRFQPSEWHAFITDIRRGEFDEFFSG